MILDDTNLAWKILTEEEKTAIILHNIHCKSSWEAGEIMGKAHYKYLEIKSRSEYLFKLFTQHFEKYNNTLIPFDVRVSDELRKYFKYTILERMPIQKAYESMNNENYSTLMGREKYITPEILRWQNSKTHNELIFYNFLLNFDRWNSHRILPKSIQEPSAYKRRNKGRLSKQLINMNRMDKKILTKIKEKFGAEENDKKLYIPIFVNYNVDNSEVIAVKNSKRIITEISKMGIYIFKDEKLVKQFIQLVIPFISKKRHHPKDGQTFWPLYRDLIKRSNNYLILQQMIPSRKFLETSHKDQDRVKLNKRRRENNYEDF